jgi:hypothetical protein
MVQKQPEAVYNNGVIYAAEKNLLLEELQMKKITVLAIAFALITGFINAQEEESAPEDQSPAQEQEQPQQAAMQMPPPALVKLWFGDLTVHGRLMTGVKAAMTDQEGLA